MIGITRPKPGDGLRREPDRFLAGDYPVVAERVTVDSAVPPHVHDFTELAVIRTGSVTHESADGVHQLGPGRVVAVRPGRWHAYRQPRSCTVINIYLKPELLHTDLVWVLGHPALAGLLLSGGVSVEALSPAQLDEVTGWLSQLARPMSQGPEQAMLRRGLIGCVLARVCGLGFTPTGSGLITAPVRSALSAMVADLARPWTVPELALTAAVSPSVLHRRFRTELGTTPIGWLTGSRAERFAVLLLAGDTPIAAIGARVGWPDPNYASRRFRQVYRQSPTDYRARVALDPISTETDQRA